MSDLSKVRYHRYDVQISRTFGSGYTSIGRLNEKPYYKAKSNKTAGGRTGGVLTSWRIEFELELLELLPGTAENVDRLNEIAKGFWYVRLVSLVFNEVSGQFDIIQIPSLVSLNLEIIAAEESLATLSFFCIHSDINFLRPPVSPPQPIIEFGEQRGSNFITNSTDVGGGMLLARNVSGTDRSTIYGRFAQIHPSLLGLRITNNLSSFPATIRNAFVWRFEFYTWQNWNSGNPALAPALSFTCNASQVADTRYFLTSAQAALVPKTEAQDVPSSSSNVLRQRIIYCRVRCEYLGEVTAWVSFAFCSAPFKIWDLVWANANVSELLSGADQRTYINLGLYVQNQVVPNASFLSTLSPTNYSSQRISALSSFFNPEVFGAQGQMGGLRNGNNAIAGNLSRFMGRNRVTMGMFFFRSLNFQTSTHPTNAIEPVLFSSANGSNGIYSIRSVNNLPPRLRVQKGSSVEGTVNLSTAVPAVRVWFINVAPNAGNTNDDARLYLYPNLSGQDNISLTSPTDTLLNVGTANAVANAAGSWSSMLFPNLTAGGTPDVLASDWFLIAGDGVGDTNATIPTKADLEEIGAYFMKRNRNFI
ncbi:MAG: hypothetical protein SFU91_00665 [Chloroherpetonaceae bacterium]|nr:hypothetical protein [Chloroherpetonaceae bacterium]